MIETEEFYKLGPKFCPAPDFGKDKSEESEVIAHGEGSL